MEQFKCPSYYDDDRVLQDCKCGNCGAPASLNLRTILESVRRGGARKADYLDSDPSNVMSVDEAVKAIEALR